MTEKNKEFAETFWTPYGTVTSIGGTRYFGEDLIGMRFKVIGLKDKSTYDYSSLGNIYVIELENGVRIEASPEEVEKEAQEDEIRNERIRRGEV